MAQQINLYNPIFLQKQKHFSAATMLQALGLLLVGVLAFYAYAVNESRTLTRVAADTRQQFQSQTEQVGKLTREFSPQGMSRLLDEEVARAGARLKQREELLALLRTGGLGNTEGFSRYLAALARQTVSGVWLTGFSIGGDESELRLSGKVLHSDLVPAYIRLLNREEVMRGRRVAEMRLTAREEKEGAPSAAPAAVAAAPAAATKPPAAPIRYVEFSIAAVRGAAVAAEAGADPKAGAK
jgi:hypothetical protein